MRLILFRCTAWLAGEGIYLAAFLFGVAIIAALLWGQLLPATLPGTP